MLDSYKIFIHGSSFRPGMSEFADISEMDFSQVTSNGLSHLANYVKDFLDSNGVQAMKVAAYSPHDLQFGMARAYDAWTFESPELVQVFKDSDMALAWLNKES
ncbi:MAG: hypothetical protein GKR91_11265 [Pseudomonadales bacterium]|nr:hypothetical protein [Pseudomonadales bacterium]